MPLTAGTFTVGASPAWLHQQQRQGLQLHQSTVVSPAHQATPAARSQSDTMQDDYATDDNEVAYERLRPDLRQLIELAKRSLLVPYRPDGPQLAVDFDDPPLGDGQQTDPDGPAKRKRVLVDGYEMEEDGEDGMNVRINLPCVGSVTRNPDVTSRVLITCRHSSAEAAGSGPHAAAYILLIPCLITASWLSSRILMHHS